VAALLAEHGVRCREDPRLVRGLDYYTKTVFEVTSADLGAQDAILGGGRYDRLVEDLGGPPLPAVGFAIGEDRLVDVMPLPAVPPAGRIRVIPLGADQEAYALAVAGRLRSGSAPVECDLSRKGVKRALAAAADLGFDEAVIVGPDEARDRTATIKDLKSREQRTVAWAELAR
jgi:histidyl-tRNA synthetase